MSKHAEKPGGILTRPRFSRLARPWSNVQACLRLVVGKDLFLILQIFIVMAARVVAEDFDSSTLPMILRVSLRAPRASK
jgi:hypothetical protein